MNARFMTNWLLPYKYMYTCTLSTFETSKITTIPAMLCFAEDDECAWLALIYY